MWIVPAEYVWSEPPISADVVTLGCEVLGHCQLETTAVSKREIVLHKTLAKGALTNDHSPPIIMKGTWSTQHTTLLASRGLMVVMTTEHTLCMSNKRSSSTAQTS